MAGAAPRDFLITYGSFSVGTGTARQIHDRIRALRLHEEFELEFSFVTTASTPAAFATEIAAVEEAFRTPNQLLQVRAGDTQTNALWYNFHPTGSGGADVGFDAEPEIVKQDDEYSSGLSRRYTVRIRLGLPANKLGSTAGQSGRRECSVSIEYEPSRRRRVTISGSYTAIGSTPARDQYEAQVDDYANAVLTDIDSDHSAADPLFELVSEPQVQARDLGSLGDRGAGFTVEFTRVYQELLIEQGASPVTGATNNFDDIEIRDQRLAIRRIRAQPATATDAKGTDRAEVSYECAIDKNAVKGRAALKAKWESDLWPFVRDQARQLLTAGGQKGETPADPLIQVEEVEFNLDENRITASMTVGGFIGGAVERGEFSSVLREESGRVLVPTWTGRPISKFEYAGPKRILVTITRRVRLSRPTIILPRIEVGDPLVEISRTVDRRDVNRVLTEQAAGFRASNVDRIDVIEAEATDEIPLPIVGDPIESTL